MRIYALADASRLPCHSELQQTPEEDDTANEVLGASTLSGAAVRSVRLDGYVDIAEPATLHLGPPPDGHRTPPPRERRPLRCPLRWSQ